eukprot:CAMPEP_0173165178 /NCGR_PEP_ID=MMETSP1105-20130129/21158_1 /TAXON_ID=2985 /ORGANISM="Ochromonas sp., Strain BG-1" /LENGTH=1859 /DNA_ID=CAMNT_0014085969 /DNA_START=279 /DNA_END=5859 /DNA_ORIENTATION=+
MKRGASTTSFVEDFDSDEYDDRSSNGGGLTVGFTNNTQSELIVEKILGRKVSLNEETKEMEELFYIKWKNMSYLHVSWERRQDIEDVDPNGKSKIKRFMLSPLPAAILGEPTNTQQNTGNEEFDRTTPATFDDEEIEYFHPDLVEVQRVLSCDNADAVHAKARKPEDVLKEKPSRKRKGNVEDDDELESSTSNAVGSEIKYLVKWRGLPYSECSWERWEDIKSFYQEVWLFWQLQKPPKLPLFSNSNPALQEYKKLEVSPVFGVSNLFPADSSGEFVDEGLRLRDYQLEGVNWLLWNWWHKRSCILADEMGLGKTIQTVTFLHQLRYMPTTSIRDIIAPLSLVDQWQSEIATWSPDMNCLLLHGSQSARETIVNNEFYYQEPYVSRQEQQSLKKANICKFHILLTTYEVAVKEIRTLTRIPWKVMIIDEAHKLKNTGSKLFSTLSTIESDHRVLLTGTPLQNKTEELWSLLNFADPKRFADMRDFMNKFGDLKSVSQVANLHEVLKPYLLRRIKEDVERSLPPKEETIVEVALTAVQKRFYRAIYERNTMYLFKGLKASNQPSLMNVMMELRKCCNHPYLVRGVEDRVLAELTPEEKDDGQITYKKLIECSGKLVLLDKLLPRLQSQGHKVLIFSQMVRVLNLLEDFLKYKGYTFERLDGSSKSSDRKEAVERFCKPSMNRFIMLLSTKAGGLGLNLTAADTVIIFDSDWNPQNDLQAQARAHRIGQTKAVMVYRLLTRKTYEMEMFHQASMKLGLDRAVLAHARAEQDEEGAGASAKSNPDAGKLNLKEIDELLKRGAYDVFREDDTDQNEFVEADIDAIMQRRTHKVVYNEGAGSITSTLGNFSKASFVSADEKEDVDINDPDFWKKAIGLKEEAGGILADPDEDEILPQQRVRKQTKVYGDQQPFDEEQLKLLLKPLKAPKPEKAQKQTQKQLQKEAAARERQLREEAKKAKALEELKLKADPTKWGSHGRDRVLRSLNMYGYGRWERIKAETGKAMMETKDLESFCRAYVLQCGLCASEQDSQKSDSPFLLEAIQAAKENDARIKRGEGGFEIPPSLQDDKFIAKLKAQSLGKKSMNKLDTLSRLIGMIRIAVERAFKEKDLSFDDSSDLDVMFNTLTAEEISRHMPLGSVRPTWARSCSWWNLECDKHLLIGVFKHGFGRYDVVKEDETLMFKPKLKELADMYALAAGKEDGEGKEDGAASIGMDVAESKEETENADVEGDKMEIEEAASESASPEKESVSKRLTDANHGSPASVNSLSRRPSSALPTADSKNALDDLPKDEDDIGDDGDDKDLDLMDDDEMGGGNKSGSTHNGIGLPDPRHLNRLITWLVSSDMARMSDSEFIETQKGKRGRSSEAKKNAAAAVAAVAAASSTGSGKGPTDQASTTAEREAALFLTLRVFFDPETIALINRVQIQGMRKCEQFLALQVPQYDAPNRANSSDDASVNDSITVKREDDLKSPETTDETKESSSNEPNSCNGNGISRTAVDDAVTPAMISEFESIRLCATLILHGAPLQNIGNAIALLMDRYSPCFGLTAMLPNSDPPSDEMTNHVYCWKDVLRISGLRLQEADCERFYQTIWLPFCDKIICTKVLSYAQNKFVVPNPLLSTSDHHFAAKGLCQMFVLRQQMLYIMYFLLVNCEEVLVDYLRSPLGRNVENMPIWWCPWIHDIGLFLGFLKHGYLSLESIYQDESLPFTKEYLQSLVQRVFLEGNSEGGIKALGKHDLQTAEDEEKFVKFSLLQYPDGKDLELRVIRILEELTRFLPDQHLCKMMVSYQLFRQFVSHGNALSEYELADQSKQQRADSAALSNRTIRSNYLRIPSVSLKHFVENSRKRRKLFISSYHPEFLIKAEED